MRIVIFSPLLELIKKPQVEGLEKENWKKERIRGQILLFVRVVVGYLPSVVGFAFQLLVELDIHYWRRLIS